ncbi:MAG: deoxyribodipyrimidine photo-lyase [Neolewinella sp.]|jgi:deoxyribodipyrimidine photo-lyase
MDMNTRAIYWLKRDFRLADNSALTAALTTYDEVVLCFILEPSALAAPETSEFHLHAQCDAFNGLFLDLRSRLKHKHLTPIGFSRREVIPTLDLLFTAEPFTHLVSHLETGGNRTFERDKAVAAWCKSTGVSWAEHRQTGVFRGPLNRDKRQKDWQAFYYTPALPVPGNLEKIGMPLPYAEPLKLPSEITPSPKPSDEVKDTWSHQPNLFGEISQGPLSPKQFGRALTAEQRRYVQPVNETAAAVTLNSFMNERGLGYSKGISSPNKAFYRCSRLSVHFAWGTISGRQAYQTVNAHIGTLKESKAKNAGTWRKNLRSFLSRLHWRDHFTQRLETEVKMEYRPLNPNFWDIQLENDPIKLNAWITGHTGFALVDACIRCMATTGYINFRMRAMLTSTAAHILHLDFRHIDKPMARLYTDYEPGIHLAQLQMQAGMVGINTLRTYSPEKQIIDQDPQCHFIHRWVPELRPFSAKEIIGRDLTEGLGDYPAAIADRTERVKAYWKIIGDLKLQPGGREITEKVFIKHGSRRRPSKPKSQKKPSAKRMGSGTPVSHKKPKKNTQQLSLWPL